MTPQSSSVIINPKQTTETWCVFEHHMVVQPGEPPVVIYVNVCKLTDVYKLIQAHQNTEWIKMVIVGNAEIMVRIVATDTDRAAIMRQAIKHSRTFNPMPVCNLRGFTTLGSRRRVVCSNGKEYASQSEAASELGLHQSAISKCMRGEIASVGGYIFTHAVAGVPDRMDETGE